MRGPPRPSWGCAGLFIRARGIIVMAVTEMVVIVMAMVSPGYNGPGGYCIAQLALGQWLPLTVTVTAVVHTHKDCRDCN